MVKKSKATNETKRKPGRPKGSKNTQPRRKAEGEIEKPLAKCPRCGCTSIQTLAKMKEMEHKGVHQGEAYTSVVWRRVQCRRCLRLFVQVERPYDPEK